MAAMGSAGVRPPPLLSGAELKKFKDSAGQRRAAYLKRLTALKNERSTWDPHWRELGEHFAPRGIRISGSERNRGSKKNGSIINSTPLRAANTLGAGMTSSVSSAARPWFRLTTPDPELAVFGRVRSYLQVCEERMRQAFQLSNFYNAQARQYRQLGVFATDAYLLDDDDETIIRAYPAPIGSYYLAASSRGRIDTYYRQHGYTVAQLVEKFGQEACSTRVQQMYSNDQLDQWVDVLHVIEPNRQRQLGRSDYLGMPWTSCWLETGQVSGGAGAAAPGVGASNVEERLLREGGYWEFPVIATRWFTTGEDVYGSDSPGMNALGDAKELQFTEKKKGQALAKLVDPPMKGPPSLKSTRASLLPAEITYVESSAGGGTYEPAMTVDPRTVQFSSASCRELEGRIDSAFYADLWAMFAREDQGGEAPTAREVAEKHEEKLLLLGPVTSNLDDESLGPSINRTFNIMNRRGLMPPPPKELQGMPLRVEYISVMAQAQRLVGTSAVERLAGFVGNLAGVYGPGATETPVTDKLDTDELVDDYALMLGVKPEVVRSADKVAEVRARRAQAQQAAQAAQRAQALAEGAKTLSQADTGGDNLLTRVVGPAAAAAAGVS